MPDVSKVSPPVIRLAQQQKYREADTQQDIADAFHNAAEEYEREAFRLRKIGDDLGDMAARKEADA